MTDKEYLLNRMIYDLREDKGVLYNLKLRNKEYINRIIRHYFVDKNGVFPKQLVSEEMKTIREQKKSVKKDIKMLRKDMKALKKEI